MGLIDANALVKRLKQWDTNDPKDKALYNFAMNRIIEQPIVDAVPVVHAKWIAQNDALTRFMCSNCKSENHEGFETYCPKCGAKMDLR